MTKYNVQKNEGGYYAIKGFVYQIDKTILEILNNPESDVSFEQTQDINFDDFVIQVKYKERVKYSPSQIKEPIVQLLELFNTDNTKKYHLYVYFKGKPEECKAITLEELNTILGKNNKFDQNLKSSFISSFILNFSTSFDEHFKNVISKIKTEFSCTSDEEALFTHGIILDHLLRKITSNAKNSIQERESSKSQLNDVLSKHKSCIFFSAYRDFLTDQKYFALIKKKFFTSRNINPFERFIVVELKGNESIFDIKDCVLKLKEKYFISPNRGGIKSGAPFIHFINISDENLKKVKQALLEEGCLLKDGHDFLNADFSLKFLKEPSTKENGVCLKFLNTKEHLLKILSENFGKTKEIYQFFLNNPIEINSDDKNIKIQIQNISDIQSIL